MHCIFLECVADDGGKACLDFELAVAKDGEVGGVFAEYKHRNKQRYVWNGLVVPFNAGKFNIGNFNGFLNFFEGCAAERDGCGGWLLCNGMRGVCDLDDRVADNGGADYACGIGGAVTDGGVAHAARVGNLNGAVPFCNGNGCVVYHWNGRVGHLVQREAILVVFREVERVPGQNGGEGAAYHVGERSFCAGGQVLFNQVENAVAVAGEDNPVVVEPVYVAFVEPFGADNLEVVAVAIDDGDSASYIVKETESDALAIGAEFRTVNIVVVEFCIGDVDVDGVFGGVVVNVFGVRDLGQFETGAVGFPHGKNNAGSLGVDGGVDCIGQVCHGNHFLAGVAYGDVEVGVSLLIAVLVADIGENGPLDAIFMNIDAFV